jgi:hypothetical protein
MKLLSYDDWLSVNYTSLSFSFHIEGYFYYYSFPEYLETEYNRYRRDHVEYN